MGIVSDYEAGEVERLGRDDPEFGPGDTVSITVVVIEGKKSRNQVFDGVVIAKRNRGLNSSFIVRKTAGGEGVERTFQTYSPVISQIKVIRRGDVRRAKLYYLRGLSGRAARLKEKLEKKRATQAG